VLESPLSGQREISVKGDDKGRISTFYGDE